MIRAVIWDLGGVLLRTEDYTSRDKLAEDMGKTRDDLEFLMYGNDSSNQAQSGEISIEKHFSNVRQSLGLTETEMENFLERFWGGDRLDFDLVDYIRSIKNGYKTGLLSNAFENLRHLITQEWKFDDAFDYMVVSAEVGTMKPDPRIYQLALNGLGVEAHEAIFVDDFIRNVEGANAVGLQAIHFRSPQQARADLERILGES
jgi:epoxide hydrolase-like predicted phosphatase